MKIPKLTAFLRKRSNEDVKEVDHTKEIQNVLDDSYSFLKSCYNPDQPNYVYSNESSKILHNYIVGKYTDLEGYDNIDKLFHAPITIACLMSDDLNIQNDLARMMVSSLTLNDMLLKKVTAQTTSVRQRALLGIRESALNITRNPEKVRYSYLVGYLNMLVNMMTECAATRSVKTHLHETLCMTSKIKSELNKS